MISPLRGAVALAERDDASIAVAKDLHFDVASLFDEAFCVDPGLFEVRLAEALDGFESLLQFLEGMADAHADAAATGGGFEHEREADNGRVFRVFQKAGAGEHGDAGGAGEFAGAVLQAEVDHLLRRGPDEGQARFFAGFGEGGVLA